MRSAGASATGLQAVVTRRESIRDAETPSATNVERRVSCAADIPVTVVELLLVRAVVDSVLQSVTSGSTTGSGRRWGAFRSHAVGLL
jgi:hypothetical protein